MADEHEEYVVQCFNCLGEYDAVEALWCHHDPHNPTKICPYCLNCFCNVPQEYQQQFWDHAPPGLKREHESFREVRQPLGNLLVQAGIITMEQMLMAVSDQSRSRERLGEILVRLGFITPEELEFFLKIQHYHPPDPLRPEHADEAMLNKLTPVYWYTRRIFPLERHTVGKKQYAIIGCTNRSQTELFEELRDLLLAHPIPILLDEEAIVAALKPHLDQSPEAAEKVFDPGKWFSQIIAGAITRGATDLHIDPTPTDIQLRIRIDGVLYKWQTVSRDHFIPILRRIRAFFKMPDTDPTSMARGSLEVRVKKKVYRLQCMILPAQYAASVTLKIVNLSDFLKDIDQLSFSPEQLVSVQSALAAPQGLVVVSGPPMHGTITTEYAFLKFMQKYDRKIATIESPIYLTIPEIQQFTPEPVQGRDIHTLLRQVVQMHPDVVYLASVPGPEILREALEAATHSLVLLDFNAMSVWEVLHWMVDHGISASQISSRLRMVINQRLVRRICPNCRHLSSIQRSLLVRMGLTPAEADRVTPYEGAGCERCNHLGYRGRVPLFELLEWTPELGEAFASGMSLEELRGLAKQLGYRSMREICLDKIQAGETTVDELQRWNIQ